MPDSSLRDLLLRFRADDALRDEVHAAFVASWGPEAAELFEGEVDVDALLAVVDEAEAPFAGALRSALVAEEGPEVDVAALVMATLASAVPPVGEAVRHEAAPTPDVAAGLDPDAAPVAAAVRWEAGAPPDVALHFAADAVPVRDAVVALAGTPPELGASFDPGALPIAAAVADEAGTVDLVAAVMAEVEGTDALSEAWLSALLDAALTPAAHAEAVARLSTDAAAREQLRHWADLGRQVREGVQAGAGNLGTVWPAVATAIGLSDPDHVPGWDDTLVGAAVREEAGTVDVAAQVLATIRRHAVAVEPDLPAPANHGRWVGIAVLASAAAAALVAVGLGALSRTSGPGADWVERPVDYASAEEVQVDKIRYGENQSVFVEVPPKGDDPVVIWVDDGGNL